jgi:hypothetical protein
MVGLAALDPPYRLAAFARRDQRSRLCVGNAYFNSNVTDSAQVTVTSLAFWLG